MTTTEWGWVLLAPVALAFPVRMAFEYCSTEPGVQADGSLMDWTQSAAKVPLSGYWPAFYLTGGFSLLAATLWINSRLPGDDFDIGPVRSQAAVLAAVWAVGWVTSQVAVGLRGARISRRVPWLARSVVSVQLRVIYALSAAVPVGVTLWALNLDDSAVRFGCVIFGIGLTGVHAQFMSSMTERYPIDLSDTNPLGSRIRTVIEAAGVRPKKLTLRPSIVMRAAVSPSGTVSMTTALVDVLSVDEVAAVVAHELAHIGNGDMQRYRTVGQWAYYGVVAMIGGLEYLAITVLHGEALLPLIAADSLLISALYATIVGAFTRPLEFACDAAAARQGLGQELASALDKMARYAGVPKDWPGFLGVFSSHPSVRDRIARLCATEPEVVFPQN